MHTNNSLALTAVTNTNNSLALNSQLLQLTEVAAFRRAPVYLVVVLFYGAFCGLKCVRRLCNFVLVAMDHF